MSHPRRRGDKIQGEIRSCCQFNRIAGTSRKFSSGAYSFLSRFTSDTLCSTSKRRARRESHTLSRKATPQDRLFSKSGSDLQRQDVSSLGPDFCLQPRRRRRMISDRCSVDPVFSACRIRHCYSPLPLFFLQSYSEFLRIPVILSHQTLRRSIPLRLLLFCTHRKKTRKKSLCGRAGSASNTWIRPLSGPRSLNAGNINPQTGIPGS